ncbi:DUF2795 domain-containing protein [Paraburkholderia caribensis]|uniref:DUF2795 domain-containing protein n=1 Tax=Paraburkholderia caribensis TaxID=75105 RepID=UPI001CC3C205|nr:DUF2795 domain-containing protein [Paraburkholderia caribensis]
MCRRRWPASITRTREKLVERARQNRANTDIVDLIDKLPDHNYDSPSAVSKEISRIQ